MNGLHTIISSLIKIMFMNFMLMHKQRRFVLILAAIGIIAVFLPWVKVGGKWLLKNITDIGAPKMKAG